jgi:hypothetical protein
MVSIVPDVEIISAAGEKSFSDIQRRYHQLVERGLIQEEKPKTFSLGANNNFDTYKNQYIDYKLKDRSYF